MTKESLSVEQLRGIWDGVYQEAERCFSFYSLLTDLDVRLVRPQLNKEDRQWDPWVDQPGLINETGHFVSRILLVGAKGEGVKEGKFKAVPFIDNRGYKCFALKWNNEPLSYLRVNRNNRLAIAGKEDEELGISKDQILFTQVLLTEPEVKGISIVSSLPAGFKEVFDRKTGMMIERQ